MQPDWLRAPLSAQELVGGQRTAAILWAISGVLLATLHLWANAPHS